MKRLFLLLFMLPISIYGQIVMSTPHRNRADLKVFVTEHEHLSDVNVYITNHMHIATQSVLDGIWTYTSDISRSTKVVYFVKYQHQSDLVVYFVKHQHQAKWKRRDKMHLMF